MKKARNESQLKTLPPERRAEIFSRLTVKTPQWPDTSYEAVKKWLADDGLQTSVTALHRFYSWYALARQLEDNSNTVETVLEDLKKSNPTITQEELDRAGQMFFSAMAIQQKDSLSWQRAQNVRIKDKLAALEDRRIKILEKKAEAFDKAQEVVKSNLTPEEQRERLKKILA